VLNNGFGLGLDARKQRSFIGELAVQGASAVAVELGKLYRRGLPEPLRDEAERHGLPLIALHRKTRFVEVPEAVHARLMDADYALLRQADDASRRLTELAVDCAPLQGRRDSPHMEAILAYTQAKHVMARLD
jgi:PucR family transcriptional regulator, purine catabolism regulatory protein